ncbi:hypothetical protein L9F63_024420, partial [Diploptera punctata]
YLAWCHKCFNILLYDHDSRYHNSRTRLSVVRITHNRPSAISVNPHSCYIFLTFQILFNQVPNLHAYFYFHIWGVSAVVDVFNYIISFFFISKFINYITRLRRIEHVTLLSMTSLSPSDCRKLINLTINSDALTISYYIQSQTSLQTIPIQQQQKKKKPNQTISELTLIAERYNQYRNSEEICEQQRYRRQHRLWYFIWKNYIFFCFNYQAIDLTNSPAA